VRDRAVELGELAKGHNSWAARRSRRPGSVRARTRRRRA
jgi:hypothetical protein